MGLCVPVQAPCLPRWALCPQRTSPQVLLPPGDNRPTPDTGPRVRAGRAQRYHIFQSIKRGSMAKPSRDTSC